MAVRFGKCCSPVPGDDIVGYITRGRGVTIHRVDCINIRTIPENEKARLIDADWQAGEEQGLYMTDIKIYATNRTGLLVDITRIFTERQIDLAMINSRTTRQGLATIEIEFEIRGKDELHMLVEKVRQVESVIDIERV